MIHENYKIILSNAKIISISYSHYVIPRINYNSSWKPTSLIHCLMYSKLVIVSSNRIYIKNKRYPG